MLKATTRIIERFRRGEVRLIRFDEHYLTDAIVAYGGPADASHLVEAAEWKTDRLEWIMPVLMAHGGPDAADALYRRFVVNDAVTEDAPDTLLHCLGWLGHPDAAELLLHYAVSDDQFLANSACLGLMSLDCVQQADRLHDAIEQGLDRGWAGELLPALSYKTGDDGLLERIWQTGCRTTFGHRNDGLIMGVALFGSRASARFEELLFDPHWAVHLAGIHTDNDFNSALKAQGLSIEDVYGKLVEGMKRETDSERLDYILNVMIVLLEGPLTNSPAFIRGLEDWSIDYHALYRRLFEWGDADGHEPLPDLLESLGVLDEKPSLDQYLRSLQDRFVSKIELQVYRDELSACGGETR